MGWRVASPPTTRAGSCRAAYRHPLYRCCLRDNVPPRSSRVRDTSRCPRLDRATSLGHPFLWSPRPAAPRRSRARPLSARLATTRSARPSYRTQSARSDAYPPGSWASSPPLPVGAPRCSMAHCHPDGSRDDLVSRRNAGGLATPPPPPLAPSLAPLRRRKGVYGCGAPSDPFGDHATACHRTGLLARRAKLVELAWLRVAREAVGAEGRVIAQPLLGDTNIPGVSCSDQRRLDIAHGVALCGDATLVAPLNRRGQPTHGSATRDGAALEAAERCKHRAYPELRRGGPQRLLVLGAETGGRWSRDCFSLMRILLTARSRRTPSLVRRAMCSGWQRRWWALLACAVQRAVAMSATSAPWASAPPTPATPPCPLAILSLANFAGPSRLGFPA